MSLFIVCVVTTTVRHIADFRTQALNGIEIVGAGGKSGILESADSMWTVASSQRYFLNGNARNFLRLVLAILSETSRGGRHFGRQPLWYFCVCVMRTVVP